MRNHCDVSVSFPARKSKIELKIAIKTWDILKATNLIALLYIPNENTAYLFEMSRYINISKQEPNTCYMTLRVVRLISYSSQTRSGTPLLLRLLDFLMIGNIWTNFGKNLSSGFSSGEKP